MTGLTNTLWDDIRRGLDAPVRLLVIGMLAAFVISLPLTVALNLIGSVPATLIYMLTGAVHALATFGVAGRQLRKEG